MKRGGPVKRTDGEEQPEALVVKGVEIQGGGWVRCGAGRDGCQTDVRPWVKDFHLFF